MTPASVAQTQDIRADGDIILVIGSEQQSLRVSSVVMKNASTVFHAMLSPGFAEGETLLRSHQVRIPLPDDDADGIFAVLCVLHGRNELVPETLAPEKVYRVAVLVDKYNLFSPLKFAARHWLDVCKATKGEDLWLLMSAAYLFQDGKAFSEATKRLVIQHTGSYRTFAAGDEIGSEVSLKICCEYSSYHLFNVTIYCV